MSSDEAPEEDIDYIEKNDLANSWRFADGKPIEQQSRARTLSRAVPTTWPQIEDAVGYGIDVSQWQGSINWSKVKNDGVDFAIIRCGFEQNYSDQDDDYWHTNAKACEKYGIPFGTYLYSYAQNTAAARSEAQHVLRLIEGYDLSYPIYYDMEDDVQEKLSKTQLADIAEAFCDTIEAAGYEVGIYASKNWFDSKLTDSRFSQWDKWVAQWNSTGCTYDGDYTMWQCSDAGKIDGISGTVDLNVDFGAAIRNGFYQDESDQNWYYYKNGIRQSSVKSIVSGAVNGEYGWWHVVNGKVTFDNTVANNSNGWWVIQNGKVNFDYDGFAENSNGWWYCKGGKVQFGTDDVIGGAVGGEWGWRVVSGRKGDSGL